MHPNNLHKTGYDFENLQKAYPALSPFVITSDFGTQTIHFSDSEAVLALNTALLKHHYGITHFILPKGYLCPPIPGRANYIHHLSDLLDDTSAIKGLDIGTGANAIYPILGSTIYNWKMVGCDINEESVKIATANIQEVSKNVEIRYQENNAHMFTNIIRPNEFYDFTMCNPPFYASAKEAEKAHTTKNKNLNLKEGSRNFGGQANELWCNGGEALFIKLMIKESVKFIDQVGWFTCLVSRKQNLPKIYKQLDKLETTHKTITMSQGAKESRFIAWKF